MTKKIAAVLALALAVGCNNKPTETKTPPTKQDPNKQGKPEPGKYTGDPEGGDFTMEEATAGLPTGSKLIARIETTKGKIECELLPDVAPITVASFVGLARGIRPWEDPQNPGTWLKQPFFDGLAFHRVSEGFMIQGGDPLSRAYGANPRIGTGSPGYRIKGEFTDKIKFDKPGLLAMARSQDPDSGGSQFFITDGPAGMLDGKYAIFGRCGNADVIKKITQAPLMEDGPREPNGKPNRPIEAITMKVEIVRI
jgi:peptidyl-prolyl cis-trans isomerase A (cyclophilin A)